MSEENTENTTPEVVVEKPVEAHEEPTAITLPEGEITGPGLGNVADGVMGSTQVKAKNKPKPEHIHHKHDNEETVAIYSSRNVFWEGVGKVVVGINIVSKSASEQWLKRNHVRIATPEEVAKEYNK